MDFPKLLSCQSIFCCTAVDAPDAGPAEESKVLVAQKTQDLDVLVKLGLPPEEKAKLDALQAKVAATGDKAEQGRLLMRAVRAEEVASGWADEGLDQACARRLWRPKQMILAMQASKRRRSLTDMRLGTVRTRKLHKAGPWAAQSWSLSAHGAAPTRITAMRRARAALETTLRPLMCMTSAWPRYRTQHRRIPTQQ